MGRPSAIFEIMGEISRLPAIAQRIDLWATLDGEVGLFRGLDGNAYEIEIRPAADARHKGLFGRLLSPKARQHLKPTRRKILVTEP